MRLAAHSVTSVRLAAHSALANFEGFGPQCQGHRVGVEASA
ncbi:Hypothetical protein MIP_02094 [Mycobacterium intracellulare subsp. intracellulare MTCC 9506]|uniref:Uncharacterized protein n=1 Tax=Mycobacterium indicus pranii (strain DSM 45239 / MTCC 9506) TaxID=1232724 RepID=J9WDT2_MYCIP|nr:Hypothetical protein MIP_02094 [Mycobacterium intracellulare subsp. intracellulare MTCC 9506]